MLSRWILVNFQGPHHHIGLGVCPPLNSECGALSAGIAVVLIAPLSLSFSFFRPLDHEARFFIRPVRQADTLAVGTARIDPASAAWGESHVIIPTVSRTTRASAMAPTGPQLLPISG